MPTLSETHRDDPSLAPRAERTEPSLYVVLEGGRVLAGGLRASLRDVTEVRFSRGRERAWTRDAAGAVTLEVPDPRMSGRHARLVKDASGWTLEDLGSTNGTFVGGARVDKHRIVGDAVVILGATALLVSTDERTFEGHPPFVDESSQRARPRGIATLVPATAAEMPRLVRVAMSTLPILLLGESGVGKEVLARTIHTLSGRGGAFVGINCGALAPNLIESQLFGHVKGAFSGAVRDEPGLLRASSGGTLFLDEIGELPAPAQATLLRALQEREVLPVGATKPIAVDLRVVAATLRPIDDAATFRHDLYARLAAFVHRMTPLRERRGDIGLLVADLLPRIAGERANAVSFAPDLVLALASHPWPLNIRQLEQVLSVALVTQTSNVLRAEDAGDALRRGSASDRPPAPSAPPEELTTGETRALTDSESRLKEELVGALARTAGNVSQVAREMGKTRMQIHRWMRRFGIVPESFR